MACDELRDKDGNIVGVICSRGTRKNYCYVCGAPMTKLCDATRKDGYPCDLPMCDEHSFSVGEDTDVCEFHQYEKYVKSAIENRKKPDWAARDLDVFDREPSWKTEIRKREPSRGFEK